MQDPRKLRVWHLAHAVALKVIETLPERRSRKVPGLRSQAIRAANSIPFNLAEGCRRSTREQFLTSIDVALGSHSELDSQLQLARDSGVISRDAFLDLDRDCSQLRRMIFALRRTIERRIAEDDGHSPENR